MDALRGIAEAAVEDTRRLRPREAGQVMEQEITERQAERQVILQRLGEVEASRHRADRALREAWEAARVEVGARVRAEILLREDAPLIQTLLEENGAALRPLCAALEAETQALADIRLELDRCDGRVAWLESRPEVRALRRQEEAQYRIKLAEIQENFGQPRWSQPPTVSLQPVRDLLRRLGPVPRLDDEQSADEELDRVAEATERLDDWLAWPRDVQVALLSLLAARLRQVQHTYPNHDERAARLFPRLSGYSRLHQPGFVYGLGRTHDPRMGTWFADANTWWTELQERLGDRPTETRPATEARPAARSRKADRTDGPEEVASPLPEDWPLHARLRGLTVLLVGGDFTRDRLDLIEEAFGFKRLDHASGHEPRAIQSFSEAIERGRFELVIILTRWLNHSASQRIVQACRSAEIRFVQTDGYSITTLRQAFEHTLGGDAAEG